MTVTTLLRFLRNQNFWVKFRNYINNTAPNIPVNFQIVEENMACYIVGFEGPKIRSWLVYGQITKILLESGIVKGPQLFILTDLNDFLWLIYAKFNEELNAICFSVAQGCAYSQTVDFLEIFRKKRFLTRDLGPKKFFACLIQLN